MSLAGRRLESRPAQRARTRRMGLRETRGSLSGDRLLEHGDNPLLVSEHLVQLLLIPLDPLLIAQDRPLVGQNRALVVEDAPLQIETRFVRIVLSTPLVETGPQDRGIAIVARASPADVP